MPFNTYPYELPALPYAYDALEPSIDTETMHYHHDKHFQTYINNLNNALKDYPMLQKLTLEQLLTSPRAIPDNIVTTVMNNAGGVYNHGMFFKKLAPQNSGGNMPQGLLLDSIIRDFGTFDVFKAKFGENSLSVFGSGWTCLIYGNNNRLKIVNLKNQETTVGLYKTAPLILFDVWEHAYYLKYKNLRSDYVAALWNVVFFPVNIKSMSIYG